MHVEGETSQTENTHERNDASDLQGLRKIANTGEEPDYANQHQKKNRERYP